MPTHTHMRREILEIPDAVENLLAKGQTSVNATAETLRANDPLFLISVARGSSDHAATYFKYVSELVAGLPVASVGPSVASIYQRRLSLSRCACIAISQSGKSPDIVRMADMAGQEGALSIAVTNRAGSDLADACMHTLELHAGEEISVAATKTFVTSAIAAVWLLAEWRQDTELLQGIRSLPRILESAANMDWTKVAQEVTSKQSLFCLGRGPSFAISNEAALKFKETCQLHAESYSSAEVLHGPVSIVDGGFPVIALTAKDEAEDSLVQVVDQIADKGASVFVTSSKTAKATPLPVARSSHPLLDPISLIVSFYAMVEQVSRARGINPDAPRHLKKVTETV